MTTATQGPRGFRTTLTIGGLLYIVMASSMLVRGPVVLAEFGVAPSTWRDAVLGDFFSFFYQLMAGLGALLILLGHVARERRAQLVTASTLAVGSALLALRDLSTSDSALGSRLYRGEKTLVFVLISVVYALAFTVLAVRAARSPAPGR